MLKLYNTLLRSVEEFKPLHPPKVGMYACGPTVYDYQHIGHMRRYVGDDILIRVLKANGYEVKHVQNITDVGHLTSDSDTGEDKMEKGAKKFGLSVWNIAKKFEKQFIDSTKALNVASPDVVMRATDYIDDQIALVEKLQEKGFAYRIPDGIYFDTSKFVDYYKLSRQNPEEQKSGARIEVVEGKKHPADFALWKFSPPGSPRQMEWYFDGPLKGKLVDPLNRLNVSNEHWVTIGFPGWHIECSAMSMKALGFTFDIHTGGIDHIPIHHTNEIAQSEAATGQSFVKYWVHHNFLVVEGEKMSKSLGNIYTVQDVINRGFDPVALRYLYLQTHYRQEMNFTWKALEAAQKALNRLYTEIATWDKPRIGCAGYEERFREAVNDDLNMPKALAIMWELIHSDYPTRAKAESIFKFDEILGLDLSWAKEKKKEEEVAIPKQVLELLEEREALRKKKRYHLADEVRHKINKLGYDVIDEKSGKTIVKPI